MINHPKPHTILDASSKSLAHTVFSSDDSSSLPHTQHAFSIAGGGDDHGSRCFKGVLSQFLMFECSDDARLGGGDDNTLETLTLVISVL
jgi:hypothetical protein